MTQRENELQNQLTAAGAENAELKKELYTFQQEAIAAAAQNVTLDGLLHALVRDGPASFYTPRPHKLSQKETDSVRRYRRARQDAQAALKEGKS